MSKKEKEIRIALINDVFHHIGIPENVELTEKKNPKKEEILEKFDTCWGIKGGNGRAESGSIIASIRKILNLFKFASSRANNKKSFVNSRDYHIGKNCIRDLLRKFKKDYNIKEL